MNYQWYPGHMTKALRQMREDIKLIDLVIEIVDARIPYSSKNPDIDTLALGKSRIIILNKADLADTKVTSLFEDYYKKQGFYVLCADSRNKVSFKSLNELVGKACAAKIEKDRKRGIVNRSVKAMVVGIPNVGKSTFINTFSGKAGAKTGNKPGVTKGKQWIRMGKDLDLLDTPGILWPKFESQKQGMKVALVGSINDAIVDNTELCCYLIEFLVKNYPDSLSQRYGIAYEENTESHIILNDICEKKNCMNKGGIPDTVRMANMIIDDLRSGKLGRISLDRI